MTAAGTAREQMTDAEYTIRYRCAGDHGAVVLIVVDRPGTAYLFSSGQLQWRVEGADACARLVRLLGRTMTCLAVAEDGPYTMAGLRQLVEESVAPRPA